MLRFFYKMEERVMQDIFAKDYTFIFCDVQIMIEVKHSYILVIIKESFTERVHEYMDKIDDVLVYIVEQSELSVRMI